MTPNEVAEVAAHVQASLFSTLGLNVELVDSASWYRERFDICGNWDSWIWETVTGKDYGTREDHFAGFVMAGDRLGKASAGIVELALRRGCAVLTCHTDGTLRTVRSSWSTKMT
jgi:hypothetical protein